MHPAAGFGGVRKRDKDKVLGPNRADTGVRPYKRAFIIGDKRKRIEPNWGYVPGPGKTGNRDSANIFFKVIETNQDIPTSCSSGRDFWRNTWPFC
jgi:hypothetical protein